MIPKVIQIIEKNKKMQPNISLKGIELLNYIQPSLLDDYLYLIVPEIVAICSKGNIISKDAIRLLEKVVSCKHFDEYIGQIVHTFIKTLEQRNDDLITEYLIFLGKSAKASYAPFLSLVINSFKKSKVSEERYEKLFQTIAFNRFEPTSIDSRELEEDNDEEMKTIEELNKEGFKIPDEKDICKNYDQEDLINVLEEFQRYEDVKLHEDWIEWMNKTSYQLLKKNPSPLIATCSNIGEIYPPLISELYNIAFVI